QQYRYPVRLRASRGRPRRRESKASRAASRRRSAMSSSTIDLPGMLHFFTIACMVSVPSSLTVTRIDHGVSFLIIALLPAAGAVQQGAGSFHGRMAHRHGYDVSLA